MRLIKFILAGLLVLLVALVAGVYVFLQTGTPNYQGDVELPGLQSPVTVYFDNFGVPHIYASNQHDVYHALGYVHAQERLFQMELLRRIGGGRLSEIFGPNLIETDKFLRTIGLNEIAEQSAKAYLSDSTELFQKAAFAYLGGVNEFVRTGPTPPEFLLLGISKEEFTPADIYRAIAYMGFSFNTGVRTDPVLSMILTQWGPEYLSDLVINSTEKNTVIPTFVKDSTSINSLTSSALKALSTLPYPSWDASNSWVIGSNKSSSGMPILANDTHIGFSQPSVWYEAHLSCPGFDFYGNHLAGVPFGLVGHSDHNAWGITIFPNDDMDFYREKSDPQNPGRVRNQDRWETLKIRNEVISIKGEEDYQFQVRTSRHGPIINQVNKTVDSLESEPVSFFWTFNKFPCKALQTAYGMAHSKKLEEFEQAISILEAPGLNFTYADIEGNIAWWGVARLLERPDHVEPKLILDGASGLDDPIGWVPFTQNPRSVNPPEGFVYSANNQPDSSYGSFHSGYYFPGARGQRIIQLLDEKDDWDVASFKQMMMDNQSPIYPEICQKIIDLLPDSLSTSHSNAVSILRNWTGEHKLKDLAPTIYYPLIQSILKNTFEDELGREHFRVFSTTMVARRTIPYLIDNDSSVWWDKVTTEQLENRETIIAESFIETLSHLTDQLGSDPEVWHWEKIHTLEHVHAIGRQKPFDKIFNVGPFPVDGGDEVINKMDFSKTSIPYRVTSGPSMRIIIDLADMQNSLNIQPTGQSGHLMSPHYKDQAALYLRGEFRPQHRSREKIVAESSKVLMLNPVGHN